MYLWCYISIICITDVLIKVILFHYRCYHPLLDYLFKQGTIWITCVTIVYGPWHRIVALGFARLKVWICSKFPGEVSCVFILEGKCQ